jgi:uncharacterized protein (DUF1778 family)
MGSEMPNHQDRSSDWVRNTLRMTAEQRDFLRCAAKASGTSLSAIVLNSACRAAEQILTDKVPEGSTTKVNVR